MKRHLPHWGKLFGRISHLSRWALHWTAHHNHIILQRVLPRSKAATASPGHLDRVNIHERKSQVSID